MNRDLPNSSIDRQSILNNSRAIETLENELDLQGISWNKETVFTLEAVAKIFDVDTRTIQRVVESNREELIQNGFSILTGDSLSKIKQAGYSINPLISNLSIFNFRAVLDIAMLLTNSNKAKKMRSQILDITLSIISKKTDGNPTFINQRDSNFLEVSYKNENGRKLFTHAVNQYVAMGIYKYEYFTNKIYQCIFLEKAKEYQRVLRLSNRTNLRDTMYSEVILCITSVECGAAYEIAEESKKLNRQLTKEEATHVIENLSKHPAIKTFIEQARNKMASRDLNFRDAEHEKLKKYITSVDPEDFERFLGEKSKSIEQQIKEHREIFLRLRDK